MKRILYIEDSITSQMIVRRVLCDTHEVTITPSPRAANLLLAEQRYDLVITDFLFPQGDAIDVIVPLRQTKTALELPIIAVSGSMDAALMTRLLKAGANACLAKPLKPLEFRAFVERMLSDPFIEHYQLRVSTVSSFQWFEHGTYHEYCPEISAHLTGTDRAELSDRIQAMLQEFAERGVALGFTTQERIRSYTVRRLPTATPEGMLSPEILDVNAEQSVLPDLGAGSALISDAP